MTFSNPLQLDYWINQILKLSMSLKYFIKLVCFNKDVNTVSPEASPSPIKRLLETSAAFPSKDESPLPRRPPEFVLPTDFYYKTTHHIHSTIFNLRLLNSPLLTSLASGFVSKVNPRSKLSCGFG